MGKALAEQGFDHRYGHQTEKCRTEKWGMGNGDSPIPHSPFFCPTFFCSVVLEQMSLFHDITHGEAALVNRSIGGEDSVKVIDLVLEQFG